MNYELLTTAGWGRYASVFFNYFSHLGGTIRPWFAYTVFNYNLHWIFSLLFRNDFITKLYYKLEAFLVRLSNLEAKNGLWLNFVLFPVAIFAKNSPVTGPSLNPEPLEKNWIFYLTFFDYLNLTLPENPHPTTILGYFGCLSKIWTLSGDT